MIAEHQQSINQQLPDERKSYRTQWSNRLQPHITADRPSKALHRARPTSRAALPS